MRVIVAVDGSRGAVLADGLRDEGIDVVAVVAASALARAGEARALYERPDDARDLSRAELLRDLTEVEIVVLQVGRDSLTESAVALTDREGARIVPLCATPADARLAAAYGVGEGHELGVEAWILADSLRAAPARTRPSRVAPSVAASPSRVVAVWGPAGAPGRSTIAIELALELARGGRHVALVDADTHAPSIAIALGIADEGPGFAAACRHAEIGGLDARELTRISVPWDGSGVDVLTGINRPSRWPELSDARVTAALAACRTWADHTVVDVGAALERDEEIVSDLDGPRRNAATLAALRSADLVVAVVAADPIGVARFLRGYTELRAAIGTTPVAVVANRLRPGALGIDARGQVRRALDRFGGIDDVWFLPMDPRSADAALLAARPIAEVAPRSPFTLALRRFVGAVISPPVSGPVPSVGRAPRRRRTRAVAVDA
ncbi:CpaE family protein [Microbacterium sp. P01]|uniref:AAA family ATPase n=1 Tax=Microbacterium sp. P01 TaxID=3366261 RepID=UPI00366BC96B